jgi:hypothetical protein
VEKGREFLPRRNRMLKIQYIRDDKNLIIGDRTTGFANGDTVPVIVAADDSAGRSRQNPTRNIVNAQILAALKVGVLLQQDDLRILIALSLCHPANSRKS